VLHAAELALWLVALGLYQPRCFTIIVNIRIKVFYKDHDRRPVFSASQAVLAGARFLLLKQKAEPGYTRLSLKNVKVDLLVTCCE
jgi:hypothetical protein